MKDCTWNDIYAVWNVTHVSYGTTVVICLFVQIIVTSPGDVSWHVSSFSANLSPNVGHFSPLFLTDPDLDPNPGQCHARRTVTFGIVRIAYPQLCHVSGKCIDNENVRVGISIPHLHTPPPPSSGEVITDGLPTKTIRSRGQFMWRTEVYGSSVWRRA